MIRLRTFRSQSHRQISIGCLAIAMILAWASLGITYKVADTVQKNLQEYNDYNLAVLSPLVAHRGNAVWFLATAGVSLVIVYCNCMQADSVADPLDGRTGWPAVATLRQQAGVAPSWESWQ